MDWDGVRVFLAVARAGRLSAAARRLAVEHTTISRRLAALEQELGTTLFYRTAAGYRLTPVGENVLVNAEAMERAALAVGARARADTGAVAGRVRLAMIPEIASHWFAAHLPAFRARYPSVNLEILVGTRPLDLSRGEADIAVRLPNPRQTGLVATRIAQSAMFLYASRKFLGPRRLRVTDVESARGLPLLVYLPQFGVLQNAAWFRPILANATIALQTNSTHTLAGSRARGGRRRRAAEARGARRRRPRRRFRRRSRRGDIWLITHPEYRRDPKIRATADFLKQVATGPKGIC